MFRIEQTYDLAGLTVLCRAARKTVRRWTRIVRGATWAIFAVGVALIALLLCWGVPPKAWHLLVFAAMLAMLLTEDRLNAWVSMRQLLPGSAHSVTVFTPDKYSVATDTTETVYHYANITSLCEAEGYFIFFLGTRHGQMFDKRGFQSGTADEFRAFIEAKTGMHFRKIK